MEVLLCALAAAAEDVEVDVEGNTVDMVAGVAAAVAEWEAVEESWYRVRLTDSPPIGYMHTQIAKNGTHYRASETMQITVRRGGTDTSTMFVETMALEQMDGQTVQMSVAQKVAKQSVSMNYIFGEDKITVSTSSAGSTYESEVPKPDPDSYVSRRIGQKIFVEKCLAGEDNIAVAMIRPELGPHVVNVTHTRKEGSFDDEPGLWKSTITGVPVDVTEGYSRNCSVLMLSEMESPFGRLRCELTGTDEVEELIKAAAGGKLDREGMPEVVDSASIVLPRFFPQVLSARKAHYRVWHTAQGVLELATSGYQRVTRTTENIAYRVDVRIDLDKPSPRLPSEDPASYLEPSVTIDSNDPLIKRLSKSFIQMAGNPKDAFKRADALRRGTRRHITQKDLATGFASASETARSKTGDCTEHGVLLAALLRAANIPSRVCNGLVYTHANVKNKMVPVFGWHMWTQALIDDAWVDLDATLDTSFNVGHLLVSTERMSDVSIITTSHLKMMTMLNNMDMEVISMA